MQAFWSYPTVSFALRVSLTSQTGEEFVKNLVNAWVKVMKLAVFDRK
mgnify:CR=1 FL=1